MVHDLHNAAIQTRLLTSCLRPSRPDIPGLHDFKGKLMHSAHYEEGYDLSNKRVAVIGAGSSGVQIVAAIQQKVQHLYHWIRSPIWITAGFAQTWAGKNGANFQCKRSL